ncbi:MAG: hypothetical protein KC766_21595 [Myxococcales bacterium]|nr:hypothetical protein [Myxococcales bacterium]
MDALKLKPAPSVKAKLPTVPKGVLAQVGATKAIWRGKADCGDLVIWAERKARSYSKSRAAPEDRVLIVCDGKTIKRSIELPAPKGDWAWREVMHGRGDRFYFAVDHKVWELAVGEDITWKQVYAERSNRDGPAEAVPLQGCIAVALDSSVISVLDAKFKKTGQKLGISGIGYAHFLGSPAGDQLLVSGYDRSSTPAGPSLSGDIVLFELKAGKLVERARGKGPARDPFFHNGSFYVHHKRKAHQVVIESVATPTPKGNSYTDRELSVDLETGDVLVEQKRKVSLTESELDLLWFLIQRLGKLTQGSDYFVSHLREKPDPERQARTFKARVLRLRMKLENAGFEGGRFEPQAAGGFILKPPFP